MLSSRFLVGLIVVHPVIDGCVWVNGELGRVGVEVNDVESVVVRVHSLVL